MNSQYILKTIRLFVRDNKLTYDDFDKVFGFLPRKEQYSIADAIQDDLNIELVDELEEVQLKEIPAKVEPLIVRQAREIKMPNKLLIRMIQDGDEQARQDLCVKNRGLVESIASRCERHEKNFNTQLTFDDLTQEGFVGMLKAAERFNFDQETEFSTYATFWIEQAIQRAIYDTGLVIRLPVHLVEKIKTLNRLEKKFLQQGFSLRRRIELIAQETGWELEDVRHLFALSAAHLNITSLDAPVGEESDAPLENFIPDEKSTLEDDVELLMLREQIDAALSTLTEREQEVLKLRFGLEDGQERTLEEVGKIFNVTRERIRQIESKALRKLRHPDRSKKLKDFLD